MFFILDGYCRARFCLPVFQAAHFLTGQQKIGDTVDPDTGSERSFCQYVLDFRGVCRGQRFRQGYGQAFGPAF